jgi:tetratricopeptide (TPR) repeat protein
MMKMIAHDMAGQIREAKEEYRRALTMSNISLGRVERNALLMAMGLKDRETIDRVLPRAIEAAPDQAPINGAALKYLDDAPAALGELRRLIDDAALQGDVFSMSTLGLWAAYFGDEMLALEALRRTAQSNAAFESWGVTLWRPVMRPVRQHAGFKALLREHGVVDYWRTSGNWGEFCTPSGTDDFECR